MKFTFLLGAGCEGNFQIGMSSGAEFQRKTILAKDAKTIANFLNNNLDIDSRSFLSWNSSSSLYQTIKRTNNTYKFNDDYQKIINDYLDYKDEIDEKNKKDEIDEKKLKEKRKLITDKFLELYRTEIYDKLENYKSEKNVNEYSILEWFLENGCFYSFADSLFNYLSNPEMYKKEVSKVIKLYYSAYSCILSDLNKKSNDKFENFELIKEFKNNNNNNQEDDLCEIRKQFVKHIHKLQKNIIYNYKQSEKEIYYKIISKKFENKLNDVNVVTTNYTNFSQKIIGLKDENIAYVHGKLDLFESLKSKHVGPIDEFSADEVIIPFIFVQSGIKPVINTRQIKELAKAVDMILESEYLIVLGYGLNFDDEHIVNFLRERIRNRKKIIYFIYCDKENKMNIEKSKINKLLVNENKDLIEYHLLSNTNSSNDFKEILDKLK